MRVSPTCAPGRVSANGREPGCTKCTGENIAASGGLTVCTACPVNTVSNVEHTSCLCAPGFYKTGSSCTACPAGKISTYAGATSCTSCPARSSPNAGRTACLCNANYYNVNARRLWSSTEDDDSTTERHWSSESSTGTDVECEACPANMVSTPGAACTCAAGFGNCDGKFRNGCENNLNALTSCGACGRTCALGANVATNVCSSGACAIGSCRSGWADCNGNYADGCEYNLASPTACTTGCPGSGAAVLNCSAAFTNAAGTCSLSGSPLTASCVLGACAAGFGNCDAQAANGCEVNLKTDVTHCGSCATNCTASLTANVGSATCSAGSCAVGTCTTGYQNCDNAFSNGCESVTNFDVNHCGSCSTNCALNALPGWATCNGGGSCIVGACASGFSACPSLGATGSSCVNLVTDVNNCGSCGNACAGAFCTATNVTSICSACNTWCEGVGKTCNATSGACQ